MHVRYMTVVDDLSVSEARTQLAAIIDRARAEHSPVYLTRHVKRIAAVIDADDLGRLIELAEDMSGILDAEQARRELRERGAAPTPWEQVKADLGLA